MSRAEVRLCCVWTVRGLKRELAGGHVDHQGKAMRYVFAKGLPTVVFAAGESAAMLLRSAETCSLLLAFPWRVSDRIREDE
jgi:hypothetical protein